MLHYGLIGVMYGFDLVCNHREVACLLCLVVFVYLNVKCYFENG